MTTTWITSGTRAVAITEDGGRVTAVKFVGVTTADPSLCPESVATSLRWSGRTLAGARRWASKVLAA